MTRKPITTTSSIRLPIDTWAKFRLVLNRRGRVWLTRFIEREHKKIVEQQDATK